MNKYHITNTIDYVILGTAAICAAAGMASVALLGIIIHLTYNKTQS